MSGATEGWNRVYGAGYGRRYPHEPLVVYATRLRAAGFGGKALDIGFGTVADLVMLHEIGFEVHGFDVAENAVEQGRHMLEERGIPARLKVWTPGEPFDYEDESFDLVVAIGCLHYNLDQAGVLAEIRRVLKPGGRILTTYHGPKFHYWANTDVVRPGVRRYADDYPNADLRGVEFVFFDEAAGLESLYGGFFDSVEVSHYFYRLTGRDTSFWIVTGGRDS